MLFAVFFEDDPDRASVREDYREEHLAFLKASGATILAAGSLRRPLGTEASGALWIVEAEDELEVFTILQKDPYYARKLRSRVDILQWDKAFADKRFVV